MKDEPIQPDSILDENKWGYIVRSSKDRTFLDEIMFCAGTGTWYVDEWVPGKTIGIGAVVWEE